MIKNSAFRAFNLKNNNNYNNVRFKILFGVIDLLRVPFIKYLYTLKKVSRPNSKTIGSILAEI